MLERIHDNTELLTLPDFPKDVGRYEVDFNTQIGRLPLQKIIALEGTDTVKRAMKIMEEHDISSICVTSKGRLIGIFTERDFVRKIALNKKWWKRVKLCEVMTLAPQVAYDFEKVTDVVRKMKEKRCRHIPVVNEYNQPLFMISVRDIISWIAGIYTAKE